jgi:hypothetical protein
MPLLPFPCDALANPPLSLLLTNYVIHPLLLTNHADHPSSPPPPPPPPTPHQAPPNHVEPSGDGIKKIVDIGVGATSAQDEGLQRSDTTSANAQLNARVKHRTKQDFMRLTGLDGKKSTAHLNQRRIFQMDSSTTKATDD